MTAQRIFVTIGICAAVAFTFITPPFQVPDEVGHFWRAESIAHGHGFPSIGPKGAVARIPDGYPWLVNVFWRDTAGRPDVKITWPQFRSAAWVRLHADVPVEVTFPAGYTPVPYLPQIAVALAGRFLHTLPPVTFYLGRLVNALAYVAIIAAAIRMAPQFGWLFAASALMPMPLYLAASWSPDAMTIASVYFFIAAAVRARTTSRDIAVLAITGAVVGFCKPAYFLVALLALAIPKLRWWARTAVLLATAAGVAFAMWNAARAFVPSRPGSHVDAAAQVACIRANPLRFPVALANELRIRGADYAEQAVGRLGLLDVRLPAPVVWGEYLLLILCAFSRFGIRDSGFVEAARIPNPESGLLLRIPNPESRIPLLSARFRVIAGFAGIATVAGIFLASYLGWTPPCARFVDGVQGRYFIPIIPLVLLTISAPLLRRETFVGAAVIIVTVAGNAAALASVVSRYYL